MQHVFIIGSRGLPAKYGGFETFVEKLIEFQQDKEIRRYLSTKRNHGNYQADTSRRIQKGSGTPAEFTGGIESIYRSPA